ncbi:hypothetical protein NDN08_005892 [Rhodosorus marinus]|uniref:Uncharacterized protein n=1 Tax=Rhodosorus marinus TaxID=101924 RepID=A0AAV8V2X3_9RHOD|nr:hypothetical protein NDN08_005892 [Rhodosorus marinus]
MGCRAMSKSGLTSLKLNDWPVYFARRGFRREPTAIRKHAVTIEFEDGKVEHVQKRGHRFADDKAVSTKPELLEAFGDDGRIETSKTRRQNAVEEESLPKSLVNRFENALDSDQPDLMVSLLGSMTAKQVYPAFPLWKDILEKTVNSPTRWEKLRSYPNVVSSEDFLRARFEYLTDNYQPKVMLEALQDMRTHDIKADPITASFVAQASENHLRGAEVYATKKNQNRAEKAVKEEAAMVTPPEPISAEAIKSISEKVVEKEAAHVKPPQHKSAEASKRISDELEKMRGVAKQHDRGRYLFDEDSDMDFGKLRLQIDKHWWKDYNQRPHAERSTVLLKDGIKSPSVGWEWFLITFFQAFSKTDSRHINLHTWIAAFTGASRLFPNKDYAYKLLEKRYNENRLQKDDGGFMFVSKNLNGTADILRLMSFWQKLSKEIDSKSYALLLRACLSTSNRWLVHYILSDMKKRERPLESETYAAVIELLAKHESLSEARKFAMSAVQEMKKREDENGGDVLRAMMKIESDDVAIEVFKTFKTHLKLKRENYRDYLFAIGDCSDPSLRSMNHLNSVADDFIKEFDIEQWPVAAVGPGRLQPYEPKWKDAIVTNAFLYASGDEQTIQRTLDILVRFGEVKDSETRAVQYYTLVKLGKDELVESMVKRIPQKLLKIYNDIFPVFAENDRLKPSLNLLKCLHPLASRYAVSLRVAEGMLPGAYIRSGNFESAKAAIESIPNPHVTSRLHILSESSALLGKPDGFENVDAFARAFKLINCDIADVEWMTLLKGTIASKQVQTSTDIVAKIDQTGVATPLPEMMEMIPMIVETLESGAREKAVMRATKLFLTNSSRLRNAILIRRLVDLEQLSAASFAAKQCDEAEALVCVLEAYMDRKLLAEAVEFVGGLKAPRIAEIKFYHGQSIKRLEKALKASAAKKLREVWAKRMTAFDESVAGVSTKEAEASGHEKKSEVKVIESSALKEWKQLVEERSKSGTSWDVLVDATIGNHNSDLSKFRKRVFSTFAEACSETAAMKPADYDLAIEVLDELDKAEEVVSRALYRKIPLSKASTETLRTVASKTSRGEEVWYASTLFNETEDKQTILSRLLLNPSVEGLKPSHGAMDTD